jgi:hypothetical protein
MKMGGARVEPSLHDCSRVGPYFQRNPLVISGGWVEKAGEIAPESVFPKRTHWPVMMC